MCVFYHKIDAEHSACVEDRVNDEDDLVWEHLHETVQTLYEEEENMLNAHMNEIQENAELLTEEGTLLASIQGDDVVDYDIDAYTSRLDEVRMNDMLRIERRDIDCTDRCM